MKINRNKQQKKRYFEQNVESNQDDLAYEEPPEKWYEAKLQDDPKQYPDVKDEEMIALRDEAKKCYDAEVANNNIKSSKNNSSFQWMKTVMSKGVIADKIAAYIVSIQDNPLYSIEQIRQLINMVKVSKKKECVTVIDHLTELFLTDLLKPHAQLKTFRERPLSLLDKLSSGNTLTRRKYLCHWYFESELKEAYASYVLALNAISHDTIEENKKKAVGAIYKLLCGNPEQEQRLLSFLANKLGDPTHKVASKVLYCLTQLLLKQPNKQAVVLNEIEKLLFRSNISTKTQYYALCFLSQFHLNHKDSGIAKKLIEVYFSFFKASIKKGEVNSRMMSALLMGVSRAYPYADLEADKISNHIATLFKILHVADYNIALHALQLLYQVSETSTSLTDRYYSALYKKLTNSEITSTTHSAILLNLLYKSLVRDKEPARVKTFIKRLLQLALMSHPSFACGILYLVSHVLSKKSDCIITKIQNNLSNLEDDEDEKYVDVKEEAVVKDEPDAQNEQTIIDNGSANKIALEETTSNENIEINKENKEQVQSAGWYHCKVKDTKPTKNDFNPLARNPLYAGGDFAIYFELLDLINHFHPTVALFANQILVGKQIQYSGDPLKDFALIRFLERFVFKNPKKIEAFKDGVHPTFGQRKSYTAEGIKSFPVTSYDYLNQEKKIPVDEMFLFNYLKSRRHSKPHEDTDDVDSVCSEEFEEMLHKMGDKSMIESDEELDFMNDIGDNLKSKKHRKTKKEDSENEDSDDFSDNFDDDEDDEDFESDENEEDFEPENDKEDSFGDLEDEDDLEMNEEDAELIGDIDDDVSEMMFTDDEEEDDDNRKSKKKKDKFENIFASADEFAELLEAEGSSKYAPGTSNAVMNKDKSDVKQIDWEAKRHRWVKGFNNATKKGHNKFGNQSKNKRKNGDRSAKVNKKRKKH